MVDAPKQGPEFSRIFLHAAPPLKESADFTLMLLQQQWQCACKTTVQQ